VRSQHLQVRGRSVRPRIRALLGSTLVGLWLTLGDVTPAAAHGAGGGDASGVAGTRALAVGAALVTLAVLAGPLVAATGPVDRVRGAVGRVAPLLVAGLATSIDLSRPAQILVFGAAATVVLAPVESRWRAVPAVVLLAVVTAGSEGAIGGQDRVLGGLHVIFGALWLGLVLEVLARWRTDPALGRRLLHRLSGPALGALVGVATTGALVASDHLGDARLALGSWWGRGLAVKIGLVVAAALLGVLLRRAWTPRLEGTMLAGVAVLGLFLAVGGSPLSGDTPVGPFLARDGAAEILVAPLRAGPNTVVVRAPDGGPADLLVVDGRPIALSGRSDGLLVGSVDLPEGRHRLEVGDRSTTVTIGPDRGGVVLRASLPTLVSDPDCLDGLAGMAAAAAALDAEERPVRFELQVGGETCGPAGGFPRRADTWGATATAAISGMRARGTAGPLLVVSDGGPRAVALVQALQGAGVEHRAVATDAFDAAVASVELGSLVLLATDPAGAGPVIDRLADVTGATVPVVLAPWLLDAAVLTEIADQGVSVLVAAPRNPTSVEAVGYRGGAARTPGGGWAITSAGYEAYRVVLEELAGVPLEPLAPAVYSASRVAILPPGMDHPSDAGWAPGVAMIRVT
jgi:hypothetical protein